LSRFLFDEFGAVDGMLGRIIHRPAIKNADALAAERGGQSAINLNMNKPDALSLLLASTV
jgi:hypothetical protein